MSAFISPEPNPYNKGDNMSKPKSKNLVARWWIDIWNTEIERFKRHPYFWTLYSILVGLWINHIGRTALRLVEDIDSTQEEVEDIDSTPVEWDHYPHHQHDGWCAWREDQEEFDALMDESISDIYAAMDSEREELKLQTEELEETPTLEFHDDRRPVLKLNEIRDGYTIIVTGHAHCDLYAHTVEYYDCGCVVTRERNCDGTLTTNWCDDCGDGMYAPRITIYNPR